MNPEGYRPYIQLARNFENFNLGTTAVEIIGVISARPMGAAPLTRILNEHNNSIERPNVRKQLIRLESMGLIIQKGGGAYGERPYELSDLGWFYVLYNELPYEVNLLNSANQMKQINFLKDFLHPYFARDTLQALDSNLPFQIHIGAFLNRCAKLILETARRIPLDQNVEAKRLRVSKLTRDQFESMYSGILHLFGLEVKTELYNLIFALFEECRISDPLKPDNRRTAETEGSRMLEVLLNDNKFNTWVDSAISSYSRNIEFYIDKRNKRIATST